MAPLPQTSDALVLRHQRLARHLAQRYVRTPEQREDLEQAAYLGLVKAARRYDPERGVPFISYAMPTILGELRRYCRDTRWAVHVPRAVQEQVQTLRRTEDALQMGTGRFPSVGEAAKALGWSPEKVLDARTAAGGLSAQSLNASVRSADGNIGEAIESLGAEDTGFADAERRDELQSALSRLTRRERRALQLRGEAGCSTPEIARRMGLSTPQASRLVGRAVSRLRAALNGDAVVCAQRHEPYVHLCDADPELFGGLDARERAVARRAAVARRVALPEGPWPGPRPAGAAPGLLVLDGILLRSVALDGKPRAELIGPGDLIRDDDDERGLMEPSWRVVAPADVAVLDRSVLETLCQWPSVIDALLRRATDRSRALAVQLAIADLRRADERLLGLFRALADRWGRRVPQGVAISVPLTHDMIAMLVGVHRPTVTSALRRLEREGRLRRTARDRWLLPAAKRSQQAPAPLIAA
jgi:RNA polymerase sigma-B factor